MLRCGTHSGALAAALLLDVCRTCVHFVGVGGSGVEVSEAANEQQRRVAAHRPTVSASRAAARWTCVYFGGGRGVMVVAVAVWAVEAVAWSRNILRR